ncbi:hypothetical protein BH09BAC1_BH09BAC1_23710 [soil metagenome]
MKRSILFTLAGFGLASMLFALVAFVEETQTSSEGRTEEYAIVDIERNSKNSNIFIITTPGTETKKILTSDLNKETMEVLNKMNNQGFELLTASHTPATTNSLEHFRYLFTRKK